jgi:putative methionine-R-sulfoxide reductase with GAF domain
MVMSLEYKDAEDIIKKLLSSTKQKSVLQDVVDVLFEGFDKYDWVGIYLVKGDTLHLGPWRGNQATEHTRIPIGIGVCGAAAKSGKTDLVVDVSKDPRYLACFLSTRSEIVVPIKKKNVVIGEIDIDSETPAAFDARDAVFLEKIADMLSQHI